MRVSIAALAISAMITVAATAADTPADAVHVGPVYTRGEQASPYPKYPDLQIEVDVPPEATADSLRPADFRLRIDNGPTLNATREQTLVSTGYGMAVSIALDVSGSMKGRPLNAVRAGLIKFVNDAGPQDKVAVQTIADDGRWDADWDAPRDQFRNALDKLTTRGRLTRLWDALLDAIQHFPVMPLSHHLVVISDGHDEGSSHKEEEVINAARDRGLTVDAIGITRSNPVFLQGLDLLARQTGGQFREAKDSQTLEQLVGNGIQRLKATPVVSFRVDDLAGDGKDHHFDVAWSHDGSQAHGETVASIPTMPVALDKRWYWAIGGAGVLLVTIAAFLLFRKKPALPMPENLGQPASATPQVTPEVSGQAYAPVVDPAGPLPPRKVAVLTTASPAPSRRSKTEFMPRFPEPSGARPAAWLLGEEGPLAGHRFAVDRKEFWIGTLENNHLRIADDPTVSGNHACLVFDHDVLGIYDHKSTNGTRLNGQLVGEKRSLLRPGDRIKIGRTTFVLQPGANGETRYE